MSAVTVIYVIREDLSKRASIANPVLRLLKDYIVNMAINLDLHVVNAGKHSSINDKLISKDEDAILDAMQKYKKDGFEVETIEEGEKLFLYTRRVVKEVAVQGS